LDKNPHTPKNLLAFTPSSSDPFLQVSVSKASGVVSVSKTTGIGPKNLLFWDYEYCNDIA